MTRGEWEADYILSTETAVGRMRYEKKIHDNDEDEDDNCGSLIWDESKKWGIKGAGARSSFFFNMQDQKL